MALIEVRNLEKTYYNDGIETPAVRGVSFDIKKGEFVAIMGPSGSGKSTLLHMLGFLDRHTKGEYYFNGKTIDDYNKIEIAHVRNKGMGFIFQDYNLLARTTVYDNVKLPLLYSNIEEFKWDKIIREAIETVGITYRIKYGSSQLSGGEKQRVAIARSLVNSPQIIFADEPTGNLDSENEKIIIGILKKLNQQGHTIVMITHEDYLAKYTQRLITMRDGKIESDHLIV